MGAMDVVLTVEGAGVAGVGIEGGDVLGAGLR